MYVNPNSANPSGVSYPTNRRKEIYKLACEYNILILEDDPYYFVQFDDPWVIFILAKHYFVLKNI